MFFRKLRRKFRHKRLEDRLVKTGQVYHHHCWEIVVSKNELLIQLGDASIHNNLMKLLIYGKSLPNYDLCLMRAALKFEFLGSLVFPISDRDTDKLPLKVYVRELFQGSYETIDEVKLQIEKITGQPTTDIFAKKVFRKMVFIINTCCPIMAETFEIRWEKSYRNFIEYAIEHDDFNFPDKSNIWRLYPKDIPHRGSIQSYILSKMPREFADKVIKEDLCTETIRW